MEFAGAIGQVGQAPPESTRGMPQVAFSGRSNVGKSSLINRLLGRTRTAIARVSAQPGKTQEINFYFVRAEPADFVLVDLPGYGYAKVPKELRDKWQPLIHGWLSRSEELAGVVQLIDIRTGPTDDDLKSVDYLAELGVPTFFALTKSDKLGKMEGQKAFAKTVKKLGVDDEQAIAFSSLKGTGREELLEVLEALLFPPADGGEGDAETAGTEGEAAS